VRRLVDAVNAPLPMIPNVRPIGDQLTVARALIEFLLGQAQEPLALPESPAAVDLALAFDDTFRMMVAAAIVGAVMGVLRRRHLAAQTATESASTSASRSAPSLPAPPAA
jgi:hypothetical protein